MRFASLVTLLLIRLKPRNAISLLLVVATFAIICRSIICTDAWEKTTTIDDASGRTTRWESVAIEEGHLLFCWDSFSVNASAREKLPLVNASTFHFSTSGYHGVPSPRRFLVLGYGQTRHIKWELRDVAPPYGFVHGTELSISLWFILALFAIPFYFEIWTFVKRIQKRRHFMKHPHICVSCRYDLRHHQVGEMCPECGTEKKYPPLSLFGR